MVLRFKVLCFVVHFSCILCVSVVIWIVYLCLLCALIIAITIHGALLLPPWHCYVFSLSRREFYLNSVVCVCDVYECAVKNSVLVQLFYIFVHLFIFSVIDVKCKSSGFTKRWIWTIRQFFMWSDSWCTIIFNTYSKCTNASCR